MPTYLVTGANRGLGLEFVRQLSSNSSNTVLACARDTSTSSTSDLHALNKHSNIHILSLDTSSTPSISALPETITKALSTTTKIDFLLNNAGINSAPEQTSLTLGGEDLAAQIQTNVFGPALTLSTLLSAGLLAQDVVVMNMTSGLGSMANSLAMTPRKCAGYSISKAALNMLTVHQAEDVRGMLKGARVVAMDPGWVKTRMGGEGAVLEPEESIGGMLKALHGLGEEDGGKFFTYTGEQVPW